MTEIYIKVSGASAVARKTGPLVAGTVGMPAHFYRIRIGLPYDGSQKVMKKPSEREV